MAEGEFGYSGPHHLPEKCFDVHVQKDRGRKDEDVFRIVELSRERARLVEEGRDDDAVPFRKGGGRISAVAANFPSFDFKPNSADDDDRISIPPLLPLLRHGGAFFTFEVS